MKYRELVKRVQNYSGFSDKESENALQLVTETLAARLTEDERKDFASQLPEELKDMTLSMSGQEKMSKDEFYSEIEDTQGIDHGHAKKQIMAVWLALKDALTPGQIDHIKTQLPNDLASELH